MTAGCGGEGQPGAPPEDDTPPAERGTYLNIVLPSIIEKDREFPVRVRVITQGGLPDYDFEGAFRIETLGPATFPEEGFRLEPVEGDYYEGTGILLHQTGVQFVRGSVPDDTVRAMANPVNVVEGPPAWRVYWGDLNGHSDLSAGPLAPAMYWWYAKGVALLDFVALTDNDKWRDRVLDDATFEEMEAVADESGEDGRFVPFLGFEWTSAERGNRIVLFSESPASLPTPAAGVDTPAKLRAALPAGSVMILPHPSGSATDTPTDPALAGSGGEELVEIYSPLGIFERAGTHRASARETSGAFVVDLLGKGFRPGFVATSDTRLTTPGNPRPLSYADHRYPGGLTAVLAKELTRAAILDALRARRCYATTGPRFLLEFTVDGQPLGSEIRVKRGHVAEAYGSLGSATTWTRAEIVGPEGTLAAVTPPAEGGDVVELRGKTAPVTAPTWLYLRGVDERGDMAWSSPVYLIPE
jgi:hypothetical protein